MQAQNSKKPLFIFITITFGFSWIFFCLPLLAGDAGFATRQIATTLSWMVAMWGPGLGAILTTLLVEKKRFASLRLGKLGNWRVYLWAWLLPVGLTVVTGILTWALGLGNLDTSFSVITDALGDSSAQLPFSPAVLVVIQIAFALTLAPLINIVFALGEELGWRGYLLPRLLPSGQWRAILFSGAIWGLWHSPAILQGLNYPGYPILGVFLMMGFCILMGAILSWLFLRANSPWAPALAHASLNAIGGLPLIFLKDVNLVIAGSLSSLLGWLPQAIFLGWLVWTARMPVQSEPELSGELQALNEI